MLICQSSPVRAGLSALLALALALGAVSTRGAGPDPHAVPTPAAHTDADTLVLHLPLDAAAADTSGHHAHCAATALTPAADHTGAANKAVHFDGLASQIVIDPPPPGIDRQITVALWLRPEEPADPLPFTDVMDGNAKLTNPVIGQDDGYHVRCWQLWANATILWHRMAEFSSCWTKTPIALGTWHHVACTFDGTTHRLYLDGTLAHEAKGIFKYDRSEPIRIGAKGDDTTPQHVFFTGDLDDLRLYNRALTAAEVAALAKP